LVPDHGRFTANLAMASHRSVPQSHAGAIMQNGQYIQFRHMGKSKRKSVRRNCELRISPAGSRRPTGNLVYMR
jgi:hypothetical protein